MNIKTSCVSTTVMICFFVQTLLLSPSTILLVNGFPNFSGHCSSGDLSNKFSGHGNSGSGSLSQGLLEVKFDNYILQPSTVTTLNSNQQYTVTLDFISSSASDPSSFFRGFLFRLSGRNNANVEGTFTIRDDDDSGNVQLMPFLCDDGISAITHTSRADKKSVKVNFEYDVIMGTELLLEVTVVRRRTRNEWFYDSFPLEVESTSATNVPSALPTSLPTVTPSKTPTVTPTAFPTNAPTAFPTMKPTVAPTLSPTASPTNAPTAFPTNAPTTFPTMKPTVAPTSSPTAFPTNAPTANPTMEPTVMPTNLPTLQPSSSATSDTPTLLPTTRMILTPSPSASHTTNRPTVAPSIEPSIIQSQMPSTFPFSMPSNEPSTIPTKTPTAKPTMSPTASPTTSPSPAPSVVASTITTIFPTQQDFSTAIPSTIPSSKSSITPSTSLATTYPTSSSSSASPSTKSACVDSPLRFRTRNPNNGSYIWRDCIWVATKSTNRRCSWDDVSSLCAKTCNTCNVCIDSNARFRVMLLTSGTGSSDEKRIVTRDCKWVGNKATIQRCKLSGVSDSCRETCRLCI